MKNKPMTSEEEFEKELTEQIRDSMQAGWIKPDEIAVDVMKLVRKRDSLVFQSAYSQGEQDTARGIQHNTLQLNSLEKVKKLKDKGISSESSQWFIDGYIAAKNDICRIIDKYLTTEKECDCHCHVDCKSYHPLNCGFYNPCIHCSVTEREGE